MNNTPPTPPTRGYHSDQIRSIQEILALATSTPSHIADIFVSFSPHCHMLSVAAHTHGWDEHTPAKFSEHIYLDFQSPDSGEKLAKQLIDFIAAIVPATPSP